MENRKSLATMAWGASGCFICFATLAGVSGLGWAVPMGVALLAFVASSGYLVACWWRQRMRVSPPR
ncbi:MAG TPA: hypothetical protein VGH79_12700 [Gaiellaceae bacterium]